MKLIDLMDKMQTNHFKIATTEDHEGCMFDRLTVTQQHDLEDHEVVCIDTTSEVGVESPITKTRDFRPLILVIVKEG